MTLLESEAGIVLDNIDDYYSYEPVNNKLMSVEEGSSNHEFYMATIRDTPIKSRKISGAYKILGLSVPSFKDAVINRDINYLATKGNSWNKNKPVPNPGLTYKNKKVFFGWSKRYMNGENTKYEEHSIILKGLDTTLIKRNNLFVYRLWEGKHELISYYMVDDKDEIDLSFIDFTNIKSLRGFISYNQFKKIMIKPSLDKYEKQAVLKDASYLFYGESRCRTLDIRGLKFDRHTEVRDLFREINIEYVDKGIKGLNGLIITPEQYKLFTSKDCDMKDSEFSRLIHNYKNDTQRILDDIDKPTSEETKEQYLEKMQGYYKEYFKNLQEREYGTFFFYVGYDFSLGAIRDWENLKKYIVIKKLEDD